MADALILEFKAKTDDLDKRLKAVEGSVDKVGKTSKKVAADMESQFKRVGGQIAAAFGIAAGISIFANAVRGAVNAAKDFEAQMSKVRAISGATNSEMERLEKSAKALGASTMFTATQVGELQEAYARLGFTTKEILAATEATLDLAAATGSTLAEAADVAGSTVRGFGLDASETVRVTDVMAMSFSKSALGMSSFAEAMKMVAPVAKIAGISIETTTAMLGKLADANLRGSLAGTALRNLLGHLADANSDLSKQLGFSVKNADDLFRAFKLLQKGNIDLTAATELTDKRSLAAFLTLINGIDTVQDLNEALDNATGSTKRMAEIMQDNLAGSITKLSSAWEGFTNQMLGSQGALKAVVDLLTDSIQGWGIILARVGGETAAQAELMATSMDLVAGAADRANKVIDKHIKSLVDNGQIAEANAKVNDILSKAMERSSALRENQKNVTDKLAKSEKELNEIKKRGQARDIIEIVKAKKEEIEQLKLSKIYADAQVDSIDAMIGVYERYIEQLNKAGGEGGAIASNTRSIASLNAELKILKDTLQNAEIGSSTFFETFAKAEAKTKELEAALRSLRMSMIEDPGFTLMDPKSIDQIAGVSLKSLNAQLAEAKKRKEEAFEFSAEFNQAIADIDRLEARIKDFGQTTIEVERDNQEQLKAIRDQYNEDSVDGWKLTDEQKLEAAGQFFNAFQNIVATAYANELATLERSLEAGQITREEFDEERKKLMRKQAEDQKALAILGAIINTAAAVTAQLSVPVGGFALAAIAAALGAIEIGVIAAQPIPQFAEGGYVDTKGQLHGRTHRQGGIHIEAEGGEFITKASQAKKYGHIVEAVNKGTIEKLIAETYVRPAVDAAMLSGFADMGRSADLNGLTAKLSDHNILRAIDRHRQSDKEGFQYLAAELSKHLRQPKRGYA